MSHTGAMQGRIIAGLKALPALAGVDVESGIDIRALTRLSFNRSTVFVVYAGLDAGEPPASNRTSQLSRLVWLLVCVATSYRGPSTAADGTGGAFELAEAVRAIRALDIGPTGRSTFLSLVSERIEPAGDRPEQGGPVAYVCEYRTTPTYI